MKTAIIYRKSDHEITALVSVAMDSDVGLNYDAETHAAIEVAPGHPCIADQRKWMVKEGVLIELEAEQVPPLRSRPGPGPDPMIQILLDEINVLRTKAGLERLTETKP